jgi:hypothetical protein
MPSILVVGVEVSEVGVGGLAFGALGVNARPYDK